MKNIITLFLCILSYNALSQYKEKLILIDEDTKKAVPFASITFNNSNHKGTTSDIDGIFYVPNKVKRITVRHVSYEIKVIEVEKINTHKIQLKQKSNELDDVAISISINPAHRIIKLAVINKQLNNPKNLKSYTYKSYDKIFLTLGKRKPSKKNDSIYKSLDSVLNQSHLFITETLAKHKYLKPNLTVDSVIATRTSGFKNPKFVLLANIFQPFSFYNEHITLFETNYLNPISRGSTRKYKFRLKDEYIKGKDTLFVISFEPKSNRNFEALKGLLIINSNKYALQGVDATTLNSGKIRSFIQQKYSYTDNKYWFPEQFNFEINLGEGAMGATYVGKSYLSEIKINTNLNKKEFPLSNTIISEKATLKNSDFWNSNRRDTLTKKEKRTYVVIDSLGEKYKFDKLVNRIPSLMKGRLPLKYVDIDFIKIAQYNKYEGIRLGLSLYTNDDVFDNLEIGVYAGYGTTDKEWKYGGDLTMNLSKTKDILVNLKYLKDLREIGLFSGDLIKSPSIQRSLIAYNMDAIEAISFNTQMKFLRNTNWSIGFSTANVKPLYKYQFIENNNLITNYINSEFNIGLNYYVNEKLTNLFGNTSRIESDDPVFQLYYSKGLKNVFNSDFSYNKFRFTLDHSFITKSLGETTYKLDLGYIDKALPYGMLFTGEGSYDGDISLIINNYFQTARPYEFLSDRYAHLFTTQNFGRLFNNKGFLQPSVVLHNNIGIGNLSNASKHQLINFSTKQELFLETGIELRNLIKIPFINMSFIGFGVGGFYRYGHHSLPIESENFVFKYSLGLTFK